MLDEAVRRIDEIYATALRDGRLRPDPSLHFEDMADVDLAAALAPEAPIGGVNGVEVSVETPDAPAVSAIESSLREAAGVSGTTITSIPIGDRKRTRLHSS